MSGRWTSVHIRGMSKHIGYIAATHKDLSALIHNPAKSRIRVYPDIISAHAALSPAASLYEATITLDEGQSFYAYKGEYLRALQFETFFDAYSAAENGSVCVRYNESRAVTELPEHLSVGPRVALL